MKVVTIEEMRRLDGIAQEQYGISGYDLMAEAGREIAGAADRRYQPKNICVVCGKGNNAGDGFVAAREFHELGRDVTVVCMESAESYRGAAKIAWERLVETKVTVMDEAALPSSLDQCDMLLDALLGTGISGAVRGRYADAISQLNSSGKPIVAADVPSGLRELNPGEEPGEIVRASLTLTIGLPKAMLLTQPGSAYVGHLEILPINFPVDLLKSDQWQLNWAQPAELAEWLPSRHPDSNKGTYGHVGIIGSAVCYSGATVLVARAALRSGCGLATVYTLPEANNVYKTALPEATSVILESGAQYFFDDISAADFQERCKSHSVMAIGPGLGTAAETKSFLHRVLETWNGPVVLDADALNLISDGVLDLLHDRQDCLVTPHPGEMSRLIGKPVKDVQADRITVARDFAAAHGVIVLLKGTGTIVARPDGQAWLIPGAEPALAKGGTGDVLTGVIAALFAQGIPMWQAAVLGASAHIAAGSQAAQKYGSRGVLSSEVADAIPLVIDSLLENQNGRR